MKQVLEKTKSIPKERGQFASRDCLLNQVFTNSFQKYSFNLNQNVSTYACGEYEKLDDHDNL